MEAYEVLRKVERRNADAGRWVLDIALGYDAVEDWPHVKSTYERAILQYTTDGAWARTQADATNVTSTTAAVEKALREDATSLHAKAQKDRTIVSEFEGAAGLYEAYLSKFAQQPKAYEVHFELTETDRFR